MFPSPIPLHPFFCASGTSSLHPLVNKSLYSHQRLAGSLLKLIIQKYHDGSPQLTMLHGNSFSFITKNHFVSPAVSFIAGICMHYKNFFLSQTPSETETKCHVTSTEKKHFAHYKEDKIVRPLHSNSKKLITMI